LKAIDEVPVVPDDNAAANPDAAANASANAIPRFGLK